MYTHISKREKEPEGQETYGLRDALLGGPGLDGYAYRAALYCIDCGQEIARTVLANGRRVSWSVFCDSEQVPTPIFFGESDCAEHCDKCGEYLYGEGDGE